MRSVWLVLPSVVTLASCSSFSGSDATSDPVDAGAADGGDSDQAARVAGCADGQREFFTDVAAFPALAACNGAFHVRGMKAASTCNHAAGDDSAHADGTGCAAADLCASGWHVCSDQADFGARGGVCTEVTGTDAKFYASAQGSGGANVCDGAGSNDLFGCGTACGAPDNSCGALTTVLTSLTPLTGWSLGTDGDNERDNVSKAAGAGGVLCCRDTK